MTIIERLEDYAVPSHSIVLTIGNFDGMHRGHQAVLKRAQTFAGTDRETESEVVVLTFRNHPSEILRPENPTSLICSRLHRIHLLQQFGIQDIILLPFTRYLAQHSAESFIERVRGSIPFSHLILGYDATLGRNRQGDHQTMQSLGEMWGFHVDYVEEYRYEGKPVSSSRIREAINEGNLTLVEDLLGRPYSIYGKAIPDTPYEGRSERQNEQSHDRWINEQSDDRLIHEKEPVNSNFHFDLSGLCLPPSGVYEVEIVGVTEDVDGSKVEVVDGAKDTPDSKDMPRAIPGKILGRAKLFVREKKSILEVSIREERRNNFDEKYLEVVFLKKCALDERTFWNNGQWIYLKEV